MRTKAHSRHELLPAFLSSVPHLQAYDKRNLTRFRLSWRIRFEDPTPLAGAPRAYSLGHLATIPFRGNPQFKNSNPYGR